MFRGCRCAGDPCSSCLASASPVRRSSSPQLPSSHLFASLAASRHRYALVKLHGCLGAALSQCCHRFSASPMLRRAPHRGHATSDLLAASRGHQRVHIGPTMLQHLSLVANRRSPVGNPAFPCASFVFNSCQGLRVGIRHKARV